MVYNLAHVLVRFNGHFGTSTVAADRWSCGMRFGFVNSEPAYDAVKLQTFVNAAKTAADTFHAATATAAGTGTFLDQATGAQIGVSGKYSPVDQETIFSPLSAVAGLGTPVHPWNTAHVVSLRTSRPRGRGSNGRVYWPALALAITAATGRISSTAVGNRVSGFAALVNSLNTAANAYSPGMKLLVASNVGGGLNVVVTSVRSDDRLDSIERRENDTPPVYSSFPVA